MIESPNELANANALMHDLLQGDEAVASRHDFKKLSVTDVQQALTVIQRSPHLSTGEKRSLLLQSWRAHYRVKPPTMKEFLGSNDWIGPTAESLYPHVQQILTEFMSDGSGYRHLILASAIGTGKSFTSTLLSLFITTHLWAMRDPKSFFGLSQATSLVHALISFSLEKASQLLLQPYMQILLSSKKFHRVKQEENLVRKQEEYPDNICWTTAGRIGVLQFSNDIHYILAASPQKLLGLNMITAILSEISFFLDQGFSPDFIWRIYQDSKARIRSRFGNRRFGTTMIDSSPNDMEKSPIDSYIFSGEALNDPSNYVITGPQWEYLPEKFPDWQATGETFPVFRGSSGLPPKILSPEEIVSHQREHIYNVPIDIKILFEENCLKNVKDYCGWPAGSQGKLFEDHESIEKMFSFQLKNLPSYIYAPASKPAEKLIWNVIHKIFFVEHSPDQFEFYRAPNAPRYIHIDQALSGDMAGISMVHPELSFAGDRVIYVTDFNLAINPGKDKINLDAIRFFVRDLRDKGRLNIKKVTFDQYQSAAAMQYLKLKGFDVSRLSVDGSMEPYQSYAALVKSGRVMAGRNIILKNNLKSLQEVTLSSGKKKIDHTKGRVVYEDGGHWIRSSMGTNGKDVSDSHCGAVWNAVHEFEGVPLDSWVSDDILREQMGDDLDPEQQFKRSLEDSLTKRINSRFGAKAV